MVPAPRPQTAKPGKKHRPHTTDAAQSKSPRAASDAQPKPEDNLYFAKVTVVAPSCVQNVRWIGKPGCLWPMSTDIACLNCCHAFEGPPAGMPVRYDDKTDTFQLWGNFCSFSCCKRYILDSRRSDRGHLVDNLALLTIKAHKENVRMRAAPKRYAGIPTAPPKTALRMFGGGLTIEDFRRGGVRITEMLAKEPFIKMSWPEALVAVKAHVTHKIQTGTSECVVQPKMFAVGRSNPVRRKNTLDAFLKG